MRQQTNISQRRMSYFSRQKPVESTKCYSNKSYKTREDSGVFCSYCKSSRQDLQAQVSQLKDKAHQSFMQVLQIQQLHEEQITLLREQFNQKESCVSLEIDKLKKQNELLRNQLSSLEKNTRKHSCEIGSSEFMIQNIDAIFCDEGQVSYLDESQLIQFTDLLKIKNKEQYISNLRNEIYKDLKFVNNNKMQIQKLFHIIREYKDQNNILTQKRQQVAKKLSLVQSQLKSVRQASESLSSQIKFMSEQIKRLGNDKLRLQKRNRDLERNQSQISQISNSQEGSQKLKIETNFTRSLRGSIKSLSPNFKMDALEHQKHPLMNASREIESKLQVNQLSYANFLGSDSIQIDQNLKKRSSNIKSKTRQL